MKLTEALRDNRERILDIWIERTLDSYESPDFFKKSKDMFANPVGGNIKTGLSELFDLLVAASDPGAYHKALDQVMRIRAVQEFTPAQAVAPVLELKWVVRQVLSGLKQEERPQPTELDNFDCDVDRAALAAFNIYVECRERLYQTRIRELKSGTHILTDTPCSSKLLRQKETKKSDIH